MCVVSMVIDHYDDRFKRWFEPFPTIQPDTIPIQPIKREPVSLPLKLEGLDELRQLIAEFKEAIAAAKKVDALTKQPDCEDPEKAKLIERVAALEARVAKIVRTKKRRTRAR